MLRIAGSPHVSPASSIRAGPGRYAAGLGARTASRVWLTWTRLQALGTRRMVQLTQSGRPSDICTVCWTPQVGQGRTTTNMAVPLGSVLE